MCYARLRLPGLVSIGFLLVFVAGFCSSARAQPFRDLPSVPTPDTRQPTAPGSAADVGAGGPKTESVIAGERRPSAAGYLGVATDNPHDGADGLRIEEAVPDSPGAKAGLKTGDRIVRVNGHAIHGTADMAAVLDTIPPGGRATFDIDRAGQSQQIVVILGSRAPRGAGRADSAGGKDTIGSTATERVGPSADKPPVPGPEVLPEPPGTRAAGGPTPDGGVNERGATAGRRALLGVRTQPVTDEVQRRLHLPAAKGALVVGRTIGSPADQAGIPLDAVIVSFNGAAVDSPQDLARAVSQLGANKSAEMVYYGEGDTHRATVRLRDFGGEPATTAPATTAPADAGPGGANVPPAAPSAGPTDTAPNATDRDTRVQALEERVRMLEQRIRDLEARNAKP